jgi:hypothetical protein
VLFLIFRRLRMLFVVVLLLPAAAAVARWLAVRVERGQEAPTVVSRALRLVESAATKARSVLR